MAPKKHASPAVSALNEGETLLQRGERRPRAEAAGVFQQAAEAFNRALQLGPPLSREQATEARFGLAESLSMWAEAVVQSAARMPDQQLTGEVEEGARARACELYSQAVQAFQRVTEPDGVTLRVDAAVNAGNALAAWGELLAAAPAPGSGAAAAAAGGAGAAGAQQQQQRLQQACSLYAQATSAYESALRQEEDAPTYSNLGDVLMQHAQALWDLGCSAEAEAACQAALQTYQQCCALTDSDNGDDLPGLLCNWAVGMCTAGQRVQDPAARVGLLDQAAQRLQACIDMARGDPEPCNALGDAYVAKAELLATASSSSAPQQAPQPVPWPAQAVGLLQQALEQGYSRALAIDRNNTEALVGTAEAHATLAKAAAAAGDAAAAQQHLASSLAAYEAALQAPAKLGGFSERCDVRYNYACVMTLAGREAEAAALFAQLLACGGITAAELAADADLAAARGAAWMQQLLARQ